ncbi:MAG: YitT family protein [Ruminococcaceae bacterium]|nr:YitT family protein [Oscillospiraceae bacterium]
MLEFVKSTKFKNFSAYIAVIAIAVGLTFNYQLFIVENGFAPAGINGIATMIQYKTGFSIGYMSLLINTPLCVLAYFLVDKTFAKRSLVFCVTYSLVFLYLQKLGFEDFQYITNGHDTIFPVILSGVISGFVYGVCFRTNSSTGGTDIVSKYISLKRPQLNFFWVTFILNAVVAAVSFFVYATPLEDGGMVYDYKPICLCVMYCFISSFVGSYIIKGTKSACKFTIITTHPNEITEEITNSLHHSSTEISALGSFSHDKKTVLICVINRHQIIDFKNIISKYDNTFAFAETVNETVGNFKQIKR